MTIAFFGGIYNPVVCLGPALFDLAFNGAGIRYVPIYLAGTFSGGALAALFYRFIYSEDF